MNLRGSGSLEPFLLPKRAARPSPFSATMLLGPLVLPTLWPSTFFFGVADAPDFDALLLSHRFRPLEHPYLRTKTLSTHFYAFRGPLARKSGCSMVDEAQRRVLGWCRCVEASVRLAAVRKSGCLADWPVWQ